MARLNESGGAPAGTSAAQRIYPAGPPTIETLEAVKRNLIRQNRNLARANSTQSLQIRTLGAEVSRLLASNIALKEEAISLREQLHESRGGYRLEGLRLIRTMMSNSLKEMTAMLDGQVWGDGDEPQPSPETRKSTCLEGMEFRERPTLKELMAAHRMPTIREHRIYPRPAPLPTETIPEAQVAGASSPTSPEIGLPPVARSDSIENEVEEQERLRDSFSTEENKPSEDAQLSEYDTTNIETRRRRKLSLSGVNSRRQSDLMLRLPDKESTILKSGAKRKLSDMYSDASETRPAKNMVREAAGSPGRTVQEEPSREDNETLLLTREDVPILRKPARKVLGEKSTNFSPKKVQSRDGKDTDKPKATRTRRSTNVLPGKKTNHACQALDKIEDIKLDAARRKEAEVMTAEVIVPPITPLPADLFSPVSSERSFVGIGKVDTPPPLELGLMSSAGAHEGARPSRRARAPVNYAEPSLVAKMRRPSKAMVDALSGLQDPRRAMIALSDGRMSSAADSELSLFDTGADAETPPQDNVASTDLSAPARDESAAESQQPTRNRKESRHPDALQEDTNRSSSIKLSSLMATGRSRHASSASEEEVMDLAVFDFDDSSSTSSPATSNVEELKPAHRAGRRHSSAVKANTSKASDGIGHAGVSTATTANRSSSVTSRRRSMMV